MKIKKKTQPEHCKRDDKSSKHMTAMLRVYQFLLGET